MDFVHHYLLLVYKSSSLFGDGVWGNVLVTKRWQGDESDRGSESFLRIRFLFLDFPFSIEYFLEI